MRATTLRTLALAPIALILAHPAAAQTPPPCTVTQTDIDKNGAPDLDIRGTTGPQTLRIDIDQTSTTVYLDCNGDGVAGGGNGDVNGAVFGVIETFSIKLQGTDVITVNFTGDISGQAKNIAIKLGAGAKNIINIGGTPAAPSPGKLLANSMLVVHIDGMVAPDTVNLTVPPVVDNSAIWFRAETGDANDHVYMYSTGAVQNGSMVDVKMDLGGHANSFDLVQSGTVTDSTVSVDLQGGPGLLDIINSSFAGTIGSGGRFLFRAALNAGNDKFTQNFDLGNLQILAGGEAHFHIDGEGGGDTMVFTRGTSVGGPGTLLAGLLDLTINGGAASDKITVDLAGGGFVTTGTMRMHIDGGAGNDTIVVNSDIAAGSTPTLDVLVHGDTGTDNITFTMNNNGANLPANYGPAATAIIDGGYFSNDVCVVSGNAIVHKRNCEL